MSRASTRLPVAAEGTRAPSRRLTVLAFGVLAVILVVLAVLMWLAALNPRPKSGEAVGDYALWVLLGIAYGGVGMLIAIKTKHVIGWLFLAIGLSLPLGTLMEVWVNYTVDVCPGCLPLFRPLLIPGALLFAAGITALVLVIHLFPSGRLPEWHGRLILRAFLLSNVIWSVTLLLRPSEGVAELRNPYAVESLQTLITGVFAVGVVGALVSATAAIIGLVIRFRRSTGIERQQIKWLSVVGATAAVIFVAGFPTQFIFGQDSWISNASWSVFFSALMFGIPLAVGFAVLRYRLYDIERIISRTFSYAIVTAVLGGIFVLVALVPATIVGSEDSPDWVVALATLLVVALFRPVRRRVQTAVDRRFNRARYDAAHTIDTFTAQLREQVDIDALGAELRSVVGRTMQPSHVSLWVRSP